MDTDAAATPYSITPGNWDDNAMTSTLNIDKDRFTTVTTLTCKITFAQADVTDPLETSTTVHIRGEGVTLWTLYNHTNWLFKTINFNQKHLCNVVKTVLKKHTTVIFIKKS